MDRIDERNRKEKMAKSIIKRRNVVYTSPEEIKDQEQAKKAQEILERLEREQQEDEDKKRMEIEKLLKEQEKNQKEIERIMNEKRVRMEMAVNHATKGE